MAYLCPINGTTDLIDYLGIRIAILKIKDNHINMFNQMTDLDKIETSMRFGLKGGLHFLFSDEKISIKNFYIDGEEHYLGLYDRPLDKQKIITRLQDEIKTSINIDNNCDIVPIAKKDYKPDYPDRLFIQIADIVLGAFRYLHQNEKCKNDTKDWIIDPCNRIIEKDQDNFARMKESRFYKGFSLSEAYIENNKWVFQQLNKKEIPELENPQISFKFF